MSFAVGDVVECVEARNCPGLEVGARYSVLRLIGGVGLSFSTGRMEAGGVLINEVSPPPQFEAFAKSQFRKITGPCERLRVEEMRREPVTA